MLPPGSCTIPKMILEVSSDIVLPVEAIIGCM